MTWRNATTDPPPEREIVWTYDTQDPTRELGWREGDEWYGAEGVTVTYWDNCEGGDRLLWHRVTGDDRPDPPKPRPSAPEGWEWTTVYAGHPALRYCRDDVKRGSVWWVDDGRLCGEAGWGCPVEVARALLALEGS